MKDIWKWIILVVIAALLAVFTTVAFVHGEQEVAGWIMVGVDSIVVGFILALWKKIMK